jgi:hypothetical protein
LPTRGPVTAVIIDDAQGKMALSRQLDDKRRAQEGIGRSLTKARYLPVGGPEELANGMIHIKASLGEGGASHSGAGAVVD